MLEKKIFIYIYEKLKNRKPLSEEDSRNFLQYVGLDRENIRQMLQVEQPVAPLSEQNYQWNHIFGKNPSLDLDQYICRCKEMVCKLLETKETELLERIDEYLIPAIKRKGDVFFALQLLERENEAGLYEILRKEKVYDFSYLKEVNERTYEVIERELIAAQNERGGIFGKREERVADLFSSVDNYIQQNYELQRYKMMENIYQIVLESLEEYWVVFPEGILSVEMKQMFETSRVTEVFERAYLESLDIQYALQESSKSIDQM